MSLFYITLLCVAFAYLNVVALDIACRLLHFQRTISTLKHVRDDIKTRKSLV